MTLDETPLTTIRGEATTFGALADGRLVLVVNVASRCGLTPQYAELEELHRRYSARGFTVIGFPSDQFAQELATDGEIAEYCSMTWGVTFPMTAKAPLNGEHAHALYTQLTPHGDDDAPAGDITWNFEKFLVSPDGDVRRFSPHTSPLDPRITTAVERWLPDNSQGAQS